MRAVPSPAKKEAREKLDDDALIDAVVNGDDRVAALLYDRLIGVVDRTLFRVLGRREVDHDDLLQSTFEQIIFTISRKRFAGACSLETWASTVASHVGLNALRARRRERSVLDAWHDVHSETLPAARSGDLQREIEVRRDVARVRIGLAEIDPAKASVLFLHDVLGHNLAEIAVMTNSSVAALQSRLVRGRRDLNERLSPNRASARTEGDDDEE